MDVLMPLACPIILCASGIYAGCDALWRRWRRARGGAPADAYPGSARQAVDRLRGQEAALADAVSVAKASRADLLAQVRSSQDLTVVLAPEVEAELIVRAADERLGHLYVAPARTRP